MDVQTLLTKTVDRLKTHEGRYAEICRQHPAISYSWITKLAHGQITDPKISSLQQLIDALDDIEGIARPSGEGAPARRIDTPEAVARLLGVPRAAAELPPSDPADPEPEVPGDSRVVPFEAPP